MKLDKYKTSFLNASDISEPTVVTVKDVFEEKVGTDEKPVLYVDAFEQGVALNRTCIMQLEEIFGSDDTDDWLGQTVVIFNDKSVMYQGKKSGGIRFRADKQAKSKTA